MARDAGSMKRDAGTAYAPDGSGGAGRGALLVASVALLAVRAYAATAVGFGDSEALYASWAYHPQPAYLDHPGLVGLVARAIGEGAAPTPFRAHVVTSIVATAVPWLAYAAARAGGAHARPAALAGLVVALVPEIAVGLFGMTPDLVLAPLWLGSLALAALGLSPDAAHARATSHAAETRRGAAFVGAGLLAGVACSAKVSGLLLFAALVVTYASVALSKEPSPARAAVRTPWPWAGLLAGLVVVVPIALYEAKLGWPMLRHRFVDTQSGAGLAARNVGALVGGQLLYVSPVVLWLAVLAARSLTRERSADPVARLWFYAFAIPFVPLFVLSVWSPVAEPHWLAPALLTLPLHAARSRSLEISPRLFRWAAGSAAAVTLLAHAWVLVPASARLRPEEADPKLDIASELYGWPAALEAVKDQMRVAGTPFDPEGLEVVVVGPHWTVCAQLHAALAGVRVGCATPIPDDFDRWLPRDEWRRAEHVLFVTDNRFGGDGAEQLPAHVRSSQSRVRVMRGGRTARTFELFLYDRRASSRATPPASHESEGQPAFAETSGAIGARPASRMSARSSSSSGFGVVSSFSP